MQKIVIHSLVSEDPTVGDDGRCSRCGAQVGSEGDCARCAAAEAMGWDPAHLGKELVRDNVQSGAEAYLLPASEPVSGFMETSKHYFQLPGKLPPGQHILAISVHNTAPSSSDLRLASVSLVEFEPPDKNAK